MLSLSNGSIFFLMCNRKDTLIYIKDTVHVLCFVCIDVCKTCRALATKSRDIFTNKLSLKIFSFSK